MVTPINLLEAAKAPLFPQTSFKLVEVLSLCHIFKEFQKKIARTLNQFNINVAYKTCNDRWLHFKKTLKTNLVKTYRQQWSIKLTVKTATKFISAKHQGP